MYQTTEKRKSTSMSYTQFKVFNRMHIIFANFDFRLIFWGYFLTSISSLALFLYSTFDHYALRIDQF